MVGSTLKARILTVVATAACIPMSFVGAPYPDELVLQHVPTVLGLVIFTIVIIRFRPSTVSFVCATLFLWLHLIGARWIYSFVPYDGFFHSVLGITLSDHFGWQRNHYDRLVHFASGILGVPIASEILQRLCGMRPRGAAVMAVMSVLAVGAMYEILEWQIAKSLSPEQAEAYNGQQGDVWDPQKDMALALFGAMIAAVFALQWSPYDGRLAAQRK
tara:strand:+ start:8491 stop:9138 length:648 start_codon:yes stop_codon:yes gene_type:complete